MRPDDEATDADGAPRVLLTATLRWPLAARLAMAFAALGCHVEVLCPRGHPARTTNAARRIHRTSVWWPLSGLHRAIDAAVPDLVVPCDDTAAVQLSRLYARLSDVSPAGAAVRRRIESSLGTPSACALATGRAELIALAAGAGVRVPPTAAVASPQALAEWLARHRLPAVLKADASWGGHGVALVHSAAQAQQAFASLSARPSLSAALPRALLDRDTSALAGAWRGTGRAITVQAHVAGLPANRAVACWQGRVLAGLSVLALRTEHATGPATVVRVIDNAEMTHAAERIVRQLGLSGLWGLDFVLDESTREAHLIEMNPRATPICHLPLGPGRDLTAALCALWRGADPATAVQPVAAIGGDLVALFPGECLRDPASVYLPLGHHDCPDGEPRFVRDCLEPPWTERGLVARAWAALRPRGPTRSAIVRHRTDPPARVFVQTKPAPGPGTRPRPGACGPRPRGATDASR